MSRNRDEKGQLTDQVTLADVLVVFETVVDCGRDDEDPNPVDPDDPIFVDRPSFSSGRGNLSQQVDGMLYGADS